MADVHRLRYTLPKFSKRSYAVLMKTLSTTLPGESSDCVAFRRHVLEVYYRHGWQAAVAAFAIGKTTLYRWKKKYEQSQRRPVSLVPISTRPHRLRSMNQDSRVIAFIVSMRETYGTISKYKIKPFLDEYTKSLGIAAIGTTTIGKIIKRKQLFYHKKKRYERKCYGSVLRVTHAPKETGTGYIEMDSITLIVMGKRWYFMSIIDVVTKYAHCSVVSGLTAQSAVHVLQTFQQTYSPLRAVQTDNGSEFLGVFHELLTQSNITHHFIYPRSPRINGVVERFNRTIQEECINRCDELFYDHHAFIQKLNAYLLWYNTKRPHHSLKLKTPFEVHNQLSTFPICT